MKKQAKEPIKYVPANRPGAKRRARGGDAPPKPPDHPDLASHRWNVGAVAWSPEGHIVILDPELREKLLRMRRGKELVIGLPPATGAGVGQLALRDGYQPYPDGAPLKTRPPAPLELCVCDGKLLRLVKVFHGQRRNLRGAGAPGRGG